MAYNQTIDTGKCMSESPTHLLLAGIGVLKAEKVNWQVMWLKPVWPRHNLLQMASSVRHSPAEHNWIKSRRRVQFMAFDNGPASLPPASRLPASILPVAVATPQAMNR